MSTVKVVRGGRLLTSEIYADLRPRTIRPPRSVFFKCPEPGCGFEHAQWSLVGQHLYHHHGYSQETIDLEECEQRKTRRNKSWLKKKFAAADTPSYVDEEGNELEEEDNGENDLKPSPMVLEAMRKLLPRDGQKEGCICPLPECSAVLQNRVDLVNHARSIHIHHPTAIGTFEIHGELFENEDDFKDWKLRLESDFAMYFACESTGRQGACKNFFFVCHRSGRVVRRMKQLRERRHMTRVAQATANDEPIPSPKKRNKIVKNQEYCTAFMRARKDSLGRVHVSYSTSHIGHDQNPALLPLTPSMKKLLLDRVIAEHEHASCSLIASRIRDEYNDPNSRLHYVSMTDVIEVIRMERKRLAKVGGEEAENALEIFRVNCKKGRRKMGQELLSTGERHKPPRSAMGGRRREEMEMDGKDLMHNYARPIKLDDDDDLGDFVGGEEEVMEDDHVQYYDEEDVDVDDEHRHGVFEEDEEVDESMMETSQQEEEEEEVEDEMSHLVSPSMRVVAVRPTQRGMQQMQQPLMEDVIKSKHSVRNLVGWSQMRSYNDQDTYEQWSKGQMDEHVDNICEALVTNGDPSALQNYLDEIRRVCSRYEHFLTR
ncbi:hypothetical protein PMAYCL1PPCAC_33419 [Pristionchus mayeri]|uniref:C2H2-type domain-containing protein n=1 Tax=Pristionchus mayeri TaxID=1317129 RepID=A0AAN5CCE2_9BILA|nr:hypothetical protein PMAYCL1PPCAC_06396 [Pristionchus mayeri]GMR63224.1 hypothetical protein PMAYCL1PPCAC_33419 [Pristionchus mayeri]